MKLHFLRIAAVAALLTTAFVAATAAPSSTASNPLRVALLASQDGQLGAVEVTVTNASTRTVRLPKWQLPSAYLESELFQLSRDGESVQYIGKLVKRPPPTAADFAVLRPGESYRAVVNLGAAYDLGKGGLYAVTYAIPLQYASLSGGAMLKTKQGAPVVLQSAPMLMSVDAAASTDKSRPQTGPIVTTLANARNVRGSIGNPATPGVAADARCLPGLPGARGCDTGVQATYLNCTTDRQNLIRDAIAGARVYTENAKGYLNAGSQGERYTWWFGTVVTGRYNSAKQNYASIDQAMDQNQGQISVNCQCEAGLESSYAYVYPNDPYKIYVCNAFWAAPMLGTDSKAGTLIHEMSHFTIVADTNDWVYGQSGAHSLAGSNPDRTSGNYSLNPIVVGNADSHEYFSENTPARN